MHWYANLLIKLLMDISVFSNCNALDQKRVQEPPTPLFVPKNNLLFLIIIFYLLNNLE